MIHLSSNDWGEKMFFTDTREQLPNGSILIAENGDNYLICNLLGRGGSSLLYSVRKMKNNMHYALKEVFPCETGIIRENGNVVAKTDKGRELLSQVVGYVRQEKEIGEQLSGSDYANPLYEEIEIKKWLDDEGNIQEMAGHFFLTVELNEKRPLKDYLEQRENVYILDCVKIMHEVVYCTSLLHQKEVIHQDLSPSNIALE